MENFISCASRYYVIVYNATLFVYKYIGLIREIYKFLCNHVTNSNMHVFDTSCQIWTEQDNSIFSCFDILIWNVKWWKIHNVTWYRIVLHHASDIVLYTSIWHVFFLKWWIQQCTSCSYRLVKILSYVKYKMQEATLYCILLHYLSSNMKQCMLWSIIFWHTSVNMCIRIHVKSLTTARSNLGSITCFIT